MARRVRVLLVLLALLFQASLARGAEPLTLELGPSASSLPEGEIRLAIEKGVDVVPLAVAGTAESLPKGSLAFRKTSATVTVLPPVSTKGLTVEDAPKLADQVREQIARLIRRPIGSSSAPLPPTTAPAAFS